MSTPAQKAHLARIRDNQRRSRQRRREYLAELEARVRSYELQGVQAFSEVQKVARRVEAENHRLRQLLKGRGVGDDDINTYLQSGAAAQDSPRPMPRFEGNPSGTASTDPGVSNFGSRQTLNAGIPAANPVFSESKQIPHVSGVNAPMLPSNMLPPAEQSQAHFSLHWQYLQQAGGNAPVPVSFQPVAVSGLPVQSTSQHSFPTESMCRSSPQHYGAGLSILQPCGPTLWWL